MNMETACQLLNLSAGLGHSFGDRLLARQHSVTSIELCSNRRSMNAHLPAGRRLATTSGTRRIAF